MLLSLSELLLYRILHVAILYYYIIHLYGAFVKTYLSLFLSSNPPFLPPKGIFSPIKPDVWSSSPFTPASASALTDDTPQRACKIRSTLTNLSPDLLASGISQALITTAFGLMIAVPGLILHRHFEQKVNKLMTH